MPAMLDDPAAPTIYRTSGAAPFPQPHDHSLPADLLPRQVTLRDRVTIATVVPFASAHQVPQSLLAYLSDQFNKEIEMGDTYPMIDGMTAEKFASYWFQNFGAIMLIGDIEKPEDVVEGRNWATECLGSFYIKPNYPGRSSHVCNAGFLVTNAARNRGVGRLMGESYLEWAPKLGYNYSVFNLVYETNVASCRIWDALGFKRIGRVKGAGNLKSFPDRLIDAIIYGRDLGPEGSDFVSEERFDKIKFYLATGKYPSGADRAEKSRLRSAATHYKLIPGPSSDGDESGIGDKLMLKDKEVISDPQRQYEIARQTHVVQHGGINKTTSTIAERFHWIRIKETVNLVIKNCEECKEMGKTPVLRAENAATIVNANVAGLGSMSNRPGKGLNVSATGRLLGLPSNAGAVGNDHNTSDDDHFADPFHDASMPILPNTSVSPQTLTNSLHSSHSAHSSPHTSGHPLHSQHQRAPMAHMHHQDHYMPLDPQIMTHLEDYGHHSLGLHHSPFSHNQDNHHHQQDFDAMTMLNSHHHHHHHEHDPHDEHDETRLGQVHGHDLEHVHDTSRDEDLDMLIEDDDDDEEEDREREREREREENQREAKRRKEEEEGGNTEEDTKARAQAAARAAEAAMRSDGKDDDVRSYGRYR